MALPSIKKSIATRLTCTMAAIIFATLSVVAFVAIRIVEDFGDVASSANQSAITEQAYSFLERLAHEQAVRHEERFRTVSTMSALLARQSGIVLDNRELFHPVAVPGDIRLIKCDANGIYYNAGETPVLEIFWGGPQISPETGLDLAALASLDPLFESIMQADASIHSASILTESGIQRCFPNLLQVCSMPSSSNFDMRYEGVYMAAGPVFNPARTTVWSSIYRDVSSSAMVITASTPIYSRTNTFLGTASITLAVPDIVRDLLHSNTSGDHHHRALEHMVPFVLNKSGVVLAMNPLFFEKIGLQRQRNNPELPGVIHVQNILDSDFPEIVEMGSRILDGEPHIGTVALHNSTYILASRQMSSTGWHFGLVVPETVLLASVHETRDNLTATVNTLSNRFSLASIISIILSVAIMALLMRRMISPLKKLSKIALQVKSGNLSVRIDHAGQDETGILGRSFNEMLDALERSRQREQEYTSTLETRVRERTQDLQVKQAQLEYTLRQLEEEMTERKQREEDLQESRNMLQLVMNNIPQAVFWKDTRSVYLGCNKTFAQAAGLDAPADIVGKTDYDLPWAKKEADGFIADDKRVMHTGTALMHIIEIQLQAGGRKAWLDTNKVPLRNSDNIVVGVLGTYEDITEKKKSEDDRARLISAIEQATELIVIMDVSGAVLYINPYALDLTRYSVAEVIGTKPFEWCQASYGDVFMQDIWTTISGGRIWRGHLTFGKKEGGTIDVQTVITPVRDKTGVIISYVAISRDVTTELQLQQELRQAQKMEAIGTLAGGIAHDFNNILSVVMGYTEMCLLQVPEDSRVHGHLKQIFTASVRAQHLIQQMLAFSRQGDMEVKPISLTPLIKETVKFLKASLPSTIAIQERLEAQSDVIMGDPTQMHQIIMNLCANAKHAMGECGGRLTISLRETVLDDIALAGRDMDPGRYLQLSVSDTGCGIDETIQEKIFNPFFTTKKPGEGTGLGLSVVHGIIKSLKGSIHLTSRPGQGATFDIVLPVMETQAQVQESQAAYDEAAGSERILVVDDEEQITAMTRRMLEMLGYDVTTRTSSLEALECFRYNPEGFDLVITDQTMPQMTGMQLAREMLAIRPSLPIVLCTGFSEVITEKKALAGGVRAFLMKPIVRSDFTRTIRRVLDDSAKEQQHGNCACY